MSWMSWTRRILSWLGGDADGGETRINDQEAPPLSDLPGNLPQHSQRLRAPGSKHRAFPGQYCAPDQPTEFGEEMGE
eukprot:s1634_g22.t1